MSGRRWTIVLTICVATMAILGASAPLFQLPQQVRSIVASRHRPIEAQLQPGERRVVLVRPSTPPLLIEPRDGEDAATFMAGFSDIVLHVKVVSRVGRLTLDRDWVVSTVTSQIVEVVKAATGFEQLKAGSAWSFAEEGGDVMVGATEVMATVPWSRPVTVGGEYVVFATIDRSGLQAGTLLTGPSGVYEVTTDGLISLMTGSGRTRRLGSRDSALAKIRGGGVGPAVSR